MTVSGWIGVVLLTCLSFGTVMTAYSNDEVQNRGGHYEAQLDGIPRTKPVNLQVLAKDTSAESVGKLMQRFEEDLGVRCAHCHVEDPQSQTFDYASDDNARKQTARLMISMLNDINEKYLAQLGGDRRYAVPITCGSCHQGQSSPPAFEARRG